ncbi:conserved hypothetical protein [Perkinsus marinus ATCC 50983]|uniref:TAFII55 protein conserved region domain-containing protein n=2 Tax=Perkinsus marinus (strain ATCC 50983 / TXsc) TaxID=423536 RepID=C5L823_PERM5|nr:conserved hypothetical protein [Perkinsus marinus ATCC 50983]EER07120.1 conserved hypothetical protein [Perkinsus marinus ATCC 50983]|eukprot:XP_002775304.1 conserved hypothetical protein [Perkinsus marinus ATCC 50983]
MVLKPPTPHQVPWPYDLQCILRLPLDIAERLRPVLEEGYSKQLDDVIDITPVDRPVEGERSRAFAVKAFEETLSGVLLDIPTFVESFKSPNNHVFTKTADVSQMLVAFRGTWSEYKQRLQEQGVELDPEFPLTLRDGLTPPTVRIRQRKWRQPPNPDQAVRNARAEEQIMNVNKGGHLEWTEEADVAASEMREREENEPSSIWRPTDEIINTLNATGLMPSLPPGMSSASLSSFAMQDGAGSYSAFDATSKGSRATKKSKRHHHKKNKKHKKESKEEDEAIAAFKNR